MQRERGTFSCDERRYAKRHKSSDSLHEGPGLASVSWLSGVRKAFPVAEHAVPSPDLRARVVFRVEGERKGISNVKQ